MPRDESFARRTLPSRDFRRYPRTFFLRIFFCAFFAFFPLFLSKIEYRNEVLKN
jgi:hypothetical protein